MSAPPIEPMSPRPAGAAAPGSCVLGRSRRGAGSRNSHSGAIRRHVPVQGTESVRAPHEHRTRHTRARAPRPEMSRSDRGLPDGRHAARQHHARHATPPYPSHIAERPPPCDWKRNSAPPIEDPPHREKLSAIPCAPPNQFNPVRSENQRLLDTDGDRSR